MSTETSEAASRCVRCQNVLPADARSCPSCSARVMSQMMIGQILAEEGLVTQAQLDEALEIQRTTGRRLGNILTGRGLVPEDVFARTLARQLDIPFFDLEDYIIDPVVVSLIPEHLCERYRLIPLMKNGDKLVVAFSDPLNQDAIADILALTGMHVRVVVSTPLAISRALDDAFDALDDSEISRERLLGLPLSVFGIGAGARKTPPE